MSEIGKALSFPELQAEEKRFMDALVAAEEAGDEESKATAQRMLDEYIRPGIVYKVDAVAYVIQAKLPASIEELKAYKKQVDAAIKAQENALNGLKDWLKHQVATEQLPPLLQGDRHIIDISNMQTPTVNVEGDPAHWEAEHHDLREIQVKYVPLKKAIAEAHAKGRTLPDGVTITYGQRLSVKLKK